MQEKESEMKRIYIENEKRIKDLQSIAQILEKELAADKTAKTNSRNSVQLKETESRPIWFGTPF